MAKLKVTTKQLHQKNRRSHNLPTFLDHVLELRNRLFWAVGCLLVFSVAAFPLKDHIIALLMAPLGNQSLYYTTPVGGISFVIKICSYVGLLLSVPVILYHVYRFLEPLLGKSTWRVSGFIIASTLLAVAGVSFAYLVSLPVALGFLTNLNIDSIQAMITADAYLSFVMTYLLGAALLFQIPLLLLIINSVRPFPPKGLMKAQRYVMTVAFVAAAIFSPTPDIVNQALLALPIIGMFQTGVICVWLQNKRRQRQEYYAPLRLQPVTGPQLIPPASQKKAPVRTFHDITPKLVRSVHNQAVRPTGSSLTSRVPAPVRTTLRRGQP